MAGAVAYAIVDDLDGHRCSTSASRSRVPQQRPRERAYEAAVRQYGERLLSVARRLLRNDEDARDTVQDALLSAFRSIDRFEERAQLSTWLHRIVVNAALMKLRARRRRPEEPREESWEQLVDTDQHNSAFPGCFEAVDAILERGEVCNLVRRCIDRLPETYRTVLLLRDIRELDTSETARLLGVSSGVVRCRLHRAHRAMRSLLAVHDVAATA